jgi:hypothetical protein
MQKWLYRLTDARVNATIRRQIARFWRSERVHIESPLRIETTRSELLIRVLRDSRGRSFWLSALQDQLGGATEATSELWQRKEELARRAGFQGVLSVIDPISGMNMLVDTWLALSEAISFEVLPRELSPRIDVASAGDACQGWPTRISSRSMIGLMGSPAWTARASVRRPDWPRLLGPTSFLRAVHRLGQELARACAPTTYPFAIANDPWHLPEYKLGCLLASLALNEDWQRRVLGLPKDHAKSQARALSRSVLQASRDLCLKVRLREAAIQSANVLRSTFVEQSAAVFGFESPELFAGQLPRIRCDDAQHLLGLWLGLTDHACLIQTFDEDWYRNPRAIATVLGQLSEINELPAAPKLIDEQLPIAARWLVTRLES